MIQVSGFEYRAETIRTAALQLDYFLVPWDTEILRRPVAEISDLRVLDNQQAARDYERFETWSAAQRIALCACRLPADRIGESMFLEDRDFRFVELNYRPQLTGLQALPITSEGIVVAPAEEGDRDALCDMAGQVFRHGRLHQDPRVASTLANLRYRAWMANAFRLPQQRVLKCLLDGGIAGFFVVETPEPKHAFWSLVGLAPGLDGRGLGKRVWRAMLDWHREEGIDTISTSISSHNTAAFNLYVSLGFRFPSPSVTLQWCPAGPLA